MSPRGRRPETYQTANPDGGVDVVTVYQSEDGWRWRRTARNGRNVGNGSEAYARKDGALRAARRSNPPVPRLR